MPGMTCTGAPGPVPSATWPGRAVNSADRRRSTVRPTTFPVAKSKAASRQVVPLRLQSCVPVSACPGLIGRGRWVRH